MAYNQGIKIAAAGLSIFAAVAYLRRKNGLEEQKSQKYYLHAAVAADTSLASSVGRDILLKGGNAVDAAIAAMLCSGLTSPQSMGIGGGFFMTVYRRHDGFSTTIDARETAPERATENMFVGNSKSSSEGPLSIAVPGEIKGYWAVHKKYGRLPWKELFQHAIKMAEEGFAVPAGLDKALQDAEQDLLLEPSLKQVFLNKETGKLYRENEIMTRPQLAETLRVIADEGANAFYNGSLTDQIVDDLKDIGSIITRNDFINYEVIEKKPLEITLNGGVRVISPPAPSGGAVLSFILNVLDGYYLTPEDIASDDSKTLTYHRIIETFKYAFSKRTGLADDRFVHEVKGLIKTLKSKRYANSVRGQISDLRTYHSHHYGRTDFSDNSFSTSHICVIDQEGNAVSATSTINGRFGSKRRGKRTGVIFNNDMDDFSSPHVINEWGLSPSKANAIVPRKRPLSSMCPCIFVDHHGKVVLILGAAGGSKITTATAWVAAHVLWLGEDIEKAINKPRLHHQLLPPNIEYEPGTDKSILWNLEEMGHDCTEVPAGKSIVQGIHIKDGRIYPVCDYRKGGQPYGY